jgi:hypothetical protein
MGACGGAGQACCASDMCSSGLACTTSDQICRSAELWIAGSNGIDSKTATAVVMHGSGTSFTMTPLGTGVPTAIWGTSASDVWYFAITSDAQNNQLSWARHWDGNTWSQPVSFTGNITALWGDAPANYWAVNNGGGAYHWTGSSWGTAETIISGAVFGQVWGANASNLWAIAGNQVARSNGNGFWDVTTRSDFQVFLSQMAGRSSGEMLSGGLDPATSRPKVLEWDGSQYTVTPLGGAQDCGPTTGVWAGPDDVWAFASISAMGGLCIVGTPTVFRKQNGGSWTMLGAVPNASVGSYLWGTSNKDLYIPGKASNGAAALLHYDGTAWTTPYLPAGVTQLRAVWGTGQPK